LKRRPAILDNRGVARKERSVRTTVLLPESLYATLKEIAEEERRSTHKQIIFALERYAEEEARRRRLSGRPLPRPEGQE
jgi:hypothetical protein